jgi:hypothetical protein
MSAAVERAKREYQKIKAMQRAAPLSEQWKFGPLLKEAKAKAYVEMELASLNLPPGTRRG